MILLGVRLNKLEQIKTRISELCVKYDVPIPTIEKNSTIEKNNISKCGVFLIPVDVKELNKFDYNYYARRIFCEYLCNLQQNSLEYSKHVLGLFEDWMQ